MFDDCMYFNIMAISRILQGTWQAEFDRSGLTNSQAYTLVALIDRPDATQLQLGELMCLNQSTMTRIMDALHRKGLIEKTVRGKGASWKVTKEGKASYRRVKATMETLRKKMAERLGAHDFEQLVERLHAAHEVLDSE